jgi:hypothetical protein
LGHLPPTDVLIRPRDNADLRLQYLLNKIDRDQWKKLLAEREKKQQRQLALRQVYECFVAISIESYRRFIDDQISSKDTLKEMHGIQQFTNDALQTISKRFQCLVRCIATFT